MRLNAWIVAAVAVGLAGTASAQHAEFVLFGNPNADAKAAPKDNKFVHPITAPYQAEDSFITSDVRVWYINHKFPSKSILGGGSVTAVAAQLRLAITDRLQLVAYKDGFLDFDSGLTKDDGWADVAAGLKYAVVQDYKSNLHWAIGAGYEFPWGDKAVLMNDAEARVWTSVDKGWGKFHLGGTFNYYWATTDRDVDFGNSDYCSWHLHADYRVTDWFSPVVEVHGYHALVTSDKTPVELHGADVVNLGKGLDDPLVTVGVGAEFRPIEAVGLRGAFEFPVTDNNDLFSSRVTFSFLYSF